MLQGGNTTGWKQPAAGSVRSSARGIVVAIALIAFASPSAIQAHELRDQVGRMQKLQQAIHGLENHCGSIQTALASGSGRLRKAISEIDDFKNLAANLDLELIGVIQQKLVEGSRAGNADVVHSALCYLLELGRSPESVPTLLQYYERARERGPFSPDFAVHALKVITEQSDLRTDYYAYEPDQAEDALRRAKAWYESWKARQAKDEPNKKGDK